MPAKKKTDELNLIPEEDNTEILLPENQTEKGDEDILFDSVNDEFENSAESTVFDDENEDNKFSGAETDTRATRLQLKRLYTKSIYEKIA